MASSSSRQAASAPRRSTAAQTVSRHREKMRTQGMRLVQFWVPDTNKPDFRVQARKQSLLASRRDRKTGVLDELDAATAELSGWRA